MPRILNFLVAETDPEVAARLRSRLSRVGLVREAESVRESRLQMRAPGPWAGAWIAECLRDGSGIEVLKRFRRRSDALALVLVEFDYDAASGRWLLTHRHQRWALSVALHRGSVGPRPVVPAIIEVFARNAIASLPPEIREHVPEDQRDLGWAWDDKALEARHSREFAAATMLH